jgi:hypothetical protein
MDCDAEALAVADCGGNLLAEPRKVDHDLRESCRRERIEVMLDQRAAADFEQRLRPRERQRPHALALPGREDHRLHAVTPRSR